MTAPTTRALEIATIAATTRALELAAIAALTAFTAAAPLAAQFTAEGEDVPPLEELLDPPRSELDALVDRFTADRNGLLRRWDLESPARRARMTAFYRGWEERLDEVPFDELGVEGRIDYLLLRNRLRYELRRLDVEAELAEELGPLLPFASTVVALHEGRRRLETVQPRQSASALSDAAAGIRTAREELHRSLTQDDGQRDGGVTPVTAVRAVERTQALRAALDSWFRHYEGYDPMFGWWVREPYRSFTRELDEYVRVLREDAAGFRPGEEEPIIGDPLGRRALLLDLEAELVPYSPEELIAIGERELAWGEEEMRRAARDLGFGEDWHAALEHVKGLHVEPGEQPELVRYLAREAEELVEADDLVSLPPLAREIWRMTMLSPATQRIAPFFFGGEVVQVAYPTDGMRHGDKVMSLRANNRHFSRNAVQHELIPGHQLQQFMTERYSTHREVFRTPFWQEGWALYWELLLWERGFPESPEDRIGMLFWRNHRAARIVFSLEYHLGRMTPEEAVEFLVDRVGHEPNSAAGEVRRSFAGSYSPLYQAGYLLGGMQLRALYGEVVESGEMTPREFHDHVVRRGNIPIEMVRASVRGELLPRDFEPSWRFDEELDR